MSNNEEPREVFPFVVFRDRPAFGDFRPGAVVKKDFRAKAVPVADALPLSAPVVEEAPRPDPKAVSSATVSVTPSEPDSSGKQTPPSSQTLPTPILSVDEVVHAGAEKDTPESEVTTSNGDTTQPVEGTGPEQGPIVPPRTATPSSPLGARPPIKP